MVLIIESVNSSPVYWRCGSGDVSQPVKCLSITEQTDVTPRTPRFTSKVTWPLVSKRPRHEVVKTTHNDCNIATQQKSICVSLEFPFEQKAAGEGLPVLPHVGHSKRDNRLFKNAHSSFQHIYCYSFSMSSIVKLPVHNKDGCPQMV